MNSSRKSSRPGLLRASAASDRTGVKVSGFAVEVLAASAGVGDPEEVVEMAVRRYLEDAQLRPPGWALAPGLEDGTEERPEVTLQIATASFEALAAEASAQGVPVETLLGHAVMYRWAAEQRPEAPPAVDLPLEAPAVSARDARPSARFPASKETSGG